MHFVRFTGTITRQAGGRWNARCTGQHVGTVEVAAGSREEVLHKLRDELRYRLELCPCTGEQYRDLEIDIVEQ